MSNSSTVRIIALATLLVGTVLAAATSPAKAYVRKEYSDYDYDYESTPRLAALKRRLRILRQHSSYSTRNMWVSSAQSAVDRYELTRSLRDLKRAMSEVERAEFFIL